jgi:hypothetical protein
MLPNSQVFWDVMLCRFLRSADVSKDVSVGHYVSSKRRGLTRATTRPHIPEDSNIKSYVRVGSLCPTVFVKPKSKFRPFLGR